MLERRLRALGLSVSLLTLALAPGCSCDDNASSGGGGADGEGASTGVANGGNGGNGATGQGGDGGTTGQFGTSENSTGTGETCAQNSAEATLVNRPVDIIVVIDNSGSMSAEIAEVEEQINLNFASILDAAMPAIDYRVILVSQFGNSASQRICVAAPLGGIPDANGDGHCDTIPAQPVNTAKFYHHSVFISSFNALCRLIQQFGTADEFGLQANGYGDVVRTDAFKFFLVITDDRVDDAQQDGCTSPIFDDLNTIAGGNAVALDFEDQLFTLAPDQFGVDALTRNYRFWSLISLAPFMPTAAKPYGDPHPPDSPLAPITLGECTPSAQNPGTGYQALSINTGGYRYPTCGLDYTDMFTLMAQGVIEGAQVACEFEIPEPPVGEKLDPETIVVEYSSDDVLIQAYGQVASLANCNADSFYIEGTTIKLCPEACDVVSEDENAKIDIKFGCVVDPT